MALKASAATAAAVKSSEAAAVRRLAARVPDGLVGHKVPPAGVVLPADWGAEVVAVPGGTVREGTEAAEDGPARVCPPPGRRLRRVGPTGGTVGRVVGPHS